MGTENAVLMAQARKSLEGRWGLAVLGFFVYWAVITAVNFIPIIGSIGGLFIGGPMVLGASIFALALARDQEASVDLVFKGFERFGTALAAYLLVILFIFLWTLLLIIPGIIAAFNYALTFFILADDETISASAAIDKSKAMMAGNRWKLFCLACRFIGWLLLCILTLFIGYFWLGPYLQVSFAKFYDDVKPIAIAEEPAV